MVPRLRISATSPDNRLVVKVYRKQLGLIPAAGYEVIVRVSDERDKLLYDRGIFQESGWDAGIGEMYSKVIFVGDDIWVGPKFSPDEFFIIRKSDLGRP